MKHHGWKRVGLISLAGVGALVALVCLALGTTLIVLKSNWGGERLRRQVVTQANTQIQGRLAIGRLSFGGNSLTVWDVALSDPEGQPVAQIARAEVDFRIFALLRKEVRVTAVIIEKPHLGLVSGPRGLNLTRATAPRERKEPEKTTDASSGSGWVVQLDRFELKDGALELLSVAEERTQEKVRIEGLQSFMSARYATTNSELTHTFRLTGRSALAPGGPFRIETQTNTSDQVIHFVMDSDLLAGTAKIRVDLPRAKGQAADLRQLDATVKVAIPKQTLHDHDWGPIRVDGVAKRGATPRLELLVALPGAELTGKSISQTVFDFQGKFSLLDLALTAKAIQALVGGDPPAAAGRGQLEFAVGGPMADAPGSWGARWTGRFDRLRFGPDTSLSGLSLDGRVAHLSAQPGEADFNLAIDTIEAGESRIGKLTFAGRVRQQDVTAEAHMVSPQPLGLTVAGRFDADRKGFALATLSLEYPQVRWALAQPARLRFGGETVSLTTLRLVSEGQAIAVEGSKQAEEVSAHLVVDKLRLDLLPDVVAAPRLHLAGTLDVDVKVSGTADNPKVMAHVALKQGRFQGFSRLFAKVDATLEDQVVDGSLSAEAPFTALEARYKLPTDLLAPGAPLDLRLDVTRLDLGDALRAAAVVAPTDGKLTMRLQASGSADNPRVELTVNGKDLSVTRPATAKSASDTVDVGHARVHLTYARRTARADVDFGSSHGGTLKVDATGKVDLSYPRVTRGLIPGKIPIEGKVVARDLEVGWISQFNERVESLGGQVNANAKLAGTVSDPQFLGDVRWKDGKVVATVPKKAASAAAAHAPAGVAAPAALAAPVPAPAASKGAAAAGGRRQTSGRR